MNKLLILSGKGGTGKTTVSAAFIKLANAKALADCDVDAPNLHLVVNENKTPKTFDFLGGDKAYVSNDTCIGCGKCEKNCRFNAIEMINNKAVINEFACEGCGVCEYICPNNSIKLSPDIAGKRELYVNDDSVFSTATLKMGRGNSGKLVSEVKLSMIKSAPDCDLAIIDGSPGIGCPVIASISGVDLVLIVAEPSLSGISDLKRLVKTTQSFGTKIAVCINKYTTSIENSNKIETFCKDAGLSFVGKIPFDKEAIRAVNNGYTVVDVDCISGKAMREIYNSSLALF